MKTRKIMKNTMKKLIGFLKKEDGPTSVEYAVILALVIVVCVGAITVLGSNSKNPSGKSSTSVGKAAR